MRTKCQSIATFHRPIHSHWSLPLKVLSNEKTGELNFVSFDCSRFKFFTLKFWVLKGRSSSIWYLKGRFYGPPYKRDLAFRSAFYRINGQEAPKNDKKKKKTHSYKKSTREHKMYFFHWWITVKRHRTHSCSTVMYCISTNFFCSAKWAAGGRAVGSGESKVGALPLHRVQHIIL
jgi:hypothetical protein